MATSTQLGVSPALMLPTEHVALPLVFSKLEVGPLCVAACVARAWRTAAATPQLWRRPLLPRDTLTDAQLVHIVARCGAHLQELDVSCCLQVTVHDVLQALRPAPRLSALHVRGVLYLPTHPTGQTRDATWAALRGCVRDDASKPLDVLALSPCGWAEPPARPGCGRLLGEQDVCSRCTTALCFSCNEWIVAHGQPMWRGICVFQCAGCQVSLCGQHSTEMKTAGCDFCPAVTVCNGCKPEADECKETWWERMGWSEGPWHYSGAHPSLRPALCRRPAEGCAVPDCRALACAECAPHAGRWLSTSTPWLAKEEEVEEEVWDEEYDDEDEDEADEDDDEAPRVPAAEQEEAEVELAAQAEDEAPPPVADAEEEEEEIDPALRLVDPADGRWVCNDTLGDYRGNNYNQMMDRYF